MILCGENPIFPPERMGCGKPIMTSSEVYRCTECTTPFHRECAVQHFERDKAATAAVARAAFPVDAEPRND